MTESITPITYDRSQMSVGVVHFGVGNFHRSHQAMCLDRLLRDPDTFDDARQWGICGVGVLEADRRMRDALAGQDYQYTLVEKYPDGRREARAIGSIIDYLYAPGQMDAVMEVLASPATRIVSLTITEGGYNIADATGEFDVTNPAVVAEAQAPTTPTTVFGIVTAGLRLRRERGLEPFTVMSCDNIEANGHVARRCFTAFARLVDPQLADWMDENVAFPSSMVDRITPVTTDQDRVWVREHYGVDDAWPVLSEGFVQWVLEDHFTWGRPAWEAVGVQMVADVRPYELMKLRLLNASHQALAWMGTLAGYEFVHEAATDPVIARFVRAYMDREATSTLDPVPGIDLDAYKDELMRRFASPYVRDTLARIITDASDRVPKFLIPVVWARRSAGERVPLSAAVVAAWTRQAERYVNGEVESFHDRQIATVRAAIERMVTDPAGFLRESDWFGDLADDPGFVQDYEAALRGFRVADPRVVIAGILDSHGW